MVKLCYTTEILSIHIDTTMDSSGESRGVSKKNPDTVLYIFLHGFDFSLDHGLDRFVVALRKECECSKGDALQYVNYHTSCCEKEKSTPVKIEKTLKETTRMIEDGMRKGFKIILVGYSYGGFLAALLGERLEDRIDGILLVAPAIDNYARNKDTLAHHYSREYADELSKCSVRPDVKKVPHVVCCHGDKDTDAGGSDMWRIQEYCETNEIELHVLKRTDHGVASLFVERMGVTSFQALCRKLRSRVLG